MYAKALSGAMAHRMTWAMGKIIHVSQQAMLPGRAMMNNIYTVDGVLHYSALQNGGATRAKDDPRGTDPVHAWQVLGKSPMRASPAPHPRPPFCRGMFSPTISPTY